MAGGGVCSVPVYFYMVAALSGLPSGSLSGSLTQPFLDTLVTYLCSLRTKTGDRSPATPRFGCQAGLWMHTFKALFFFRERGR